MGWDKNGGLDPARSMQQTHVDMLQRLLLLLFWSNIAITFHKCKNLKVRKLMVVNSQQMHISFTNCLRVGASHVKVIAPSKSPNTDGIHISKSRGVEVKNSIVRTGDYCISIVGNSSVIRVRNIACGPGHGISIGSLGKSNSSAMIRDIMVYGAFISNTENGVRIKTWQTSAVKSREHIL